MSKTLRKPRVVVMLIALCLAVSCFITGGATAVAEEYDGPHWATVKFSGPIPIKEMNIRWDWNDLLQDATKAEESFNLAVAGIVMSQQAELASKNVESVLGELGFEDLKSEYYRLSTETENDISEPARTFGHKAITKNGKEYHIVCAVFKGTTTLDDALTDVKSVTDGFYKAGANCTKSLEAYVKSISGATKDNTVLFITGHSLGASTANVVGRLSGSLAYDSAKFVYTFASPNYRTDGEESQGTFNNFHTYTNTADAVPKVPLNIAPKHFTKIGVEHKYTRSALNDDQASKFERVYTFLMGKSFEKDTEHLATLKNHLCETYMSFVLSDLSNEDIDRHIAMSRENPITVSGKTATIAPNKATSLNVSKVLTAKDQKGSLTYTKKSGNGYVTIAKDGTVHVKKGIKSGTHTIYVSVRDSGDEFYLPKTVTAYFNVKVKNVNTLSVAGKTAAIDAGKKVSLKSSKVLTVKNAKGALTYTKKSGDQHIAVRKNGTIVVKKGLQAGKTYTVKVAVKAAGNSDYMEKTITKSFKVKVKKTNTLTVTGKTAKIDAGKKVTLYRAKVLAVKKAKGALSYSKKSGNELIVVRKNGNVVVKNGLQAGKTYTVKVAVKAAGNDSYSAKTITKAFKVKVKPSIATASTQLTAAKL